MNTSPTGARGLVVRGLTRSFGGRTVVEDVDLRIAPGRVVGLLGPNGAGKTTIFRMLIGLLRPARGSIVLDGLDITGWPVHRRARAGLGYLAQSPSVFHAMTVRENLLTALEIGGVPRSEHEPRAAALLEEVGLAGLSGQRASTLSGGERRRVEIARALCVDPTVLILDEPFASIDPKMASDLGALILQLRDRGLGLLLTDHGAQQLLPLCGEVNVLLEGRVMASGDVESVVRDPRVRNNYLGEEFAL